MTQQFAYIRYRASAVLFDLVQHYIDSVMIHPLANLWVFEKPVEILNLGPFMRRMAVSTVSTVKKATHSLINTLVPRISEAQTVAAAEYFSGIVGSGPFSREFGPIPEPFIALRTVRTTR